MNRHQAFTLIEVLVSLSLGMLLITLAWSAYSSSDQIAKRTLARLALHQDAGQVHQAMANDFRTIHHGAAWQAEGQAGAAGSVISLTALRGVMRSGWKSATGYQGSSQVDWFTHPSTSSDENLGEVPSDLTWVRWRWKVDAASGSTRVGTLYRAMNPVMRRTYTGGTNWSQPRRSADRPLDDNNWQTLFQLSAPVLRNNDPRSDEEDLEANLVPIAFRVKDLALAWTTAGGAVVNLDAATLPAAVESHPIDGVWLDGHDITLARLRPAVLRVRFTLVDLQANLDADPDALEPGVVQQSFVWSVPLTPLVRP